MASKQVNLTVIYDLNCPFCYIGQKDIFSAIDEVTKQYNTLHFQVEFRPYVLHPSIKPGQPQDRATYCTNAFGQERAAACRKKFLERSKDVGLEVKDGGILVNTDRAHRLAYRAWKKGGQSLQQTVLSNLFHALIVDHKDISNVEILSEIAKASCLMGKDEATTYLNSDEDVQAVEDQIEGVRKGGISGVPVLIIEGKWAISGGQTRDVYLQVFKKLANCKAFINNTCSPESTAKALSAKIVV
ncbi:thioredoxin-like protein [Thelephora terrestris]|uniref:Thioredoxin-like protein n=1 Tax=Thelephora terrestris TaxID=56493 RepID=A0A9P6LB97_9AGAM|nr:thioredoxin-like protein [Thelephora terrestris]